MLIRFQFLFVFKIATLLFGGALITTASVVAQRFQWPEKAENLTVLPDTISGQQLGQVMRGFTRALGVRCEHCHVGEPGQSLSEFDFVSNDKEAKQKARVMMRMVKSINENYIAELSNLEEDDHARLSVTCTTCHRGRAIPAMLQDLMTDTALGNGVDSAITQYRELRDQYYGGFSFDFREGTLTDVADRIAGEGNFSDALKVMELEIEINGETVRSLASLSELQSQAGMKPDAIKTLKRALEIAPERMKDGLTRQLQRLKE